MGDYLSDKEARQAIVEVGRRLYERGFVAANDGNISVRTGENELWITPSGVSKGSMTEKMLIKTDLNGRVLKGRGMVSTEAKMHFAAYRSSPKIRSLCHAHPPYATLLSMTERSLDIPIMPEAVVILGPVPVMPYARPGSVELAEDMVPYFTTHNAVLLAHHGASTWGDNPIKALYNMEILEHYSKILYLSGLAGKSAAPLSDSQVRELLQLRGD